MSLSYTHAHQQGSGTTEVVAVLVAMTNDSARVLTVDGGKLLPNGPLMPLHRSLQAGVRQWVEEQTQQPLGYIEQLYTFVDTNRRNPEGHALVYVSYLGLVQETQLSQLPTQASWQDWYAYFPWENHLDGVPECLLSHIAPALIRWAYTATDGIQQHRRCQRVRLCWGIDWADTAINADVDILNDNSNGNNGVAGDEKQTVALGDVGQLSITLTNWVAEHALLRYEMLYEAGLIPESPAYQPHKLNKQLGMQISNEPSAILGKPMYYDHRRVIATAISRLRAKIEYRPLIFGLMPNEFTVSQLQKSVEALSGVPLHTQNFRHLIEHQNLIEATGHSVSASRGRPAKLYRFRYDIELQSLLMDSKLPKQK